MAASSSPAALCTHSPLVCKAEATAGKHKEQTKRPSWTQTKTIGSSNNIKSFTGKVHEKKFKGRRIRTIVTEKGEERRKSRTQREEAAHAGNSDGRRRQRRGRERMDSHKRSKITAQNFDLIQVQLTNSFTSTFTDADQNPFHTTWY
jgi:hypothetical protein